MDQDYEKIKEYLTANLNVKFTELGIQDESKGKWVKAEKISNRFLIRHLKTNVVPDSDITTSKIGSFVYHQCSDLLQANEFWKTQKGHTSFFYSWNVEEREKNNGDGFSELKTIIDCPNLVPIDYVKAVRRRITEMVEEWKSPVVVKFGITGKMRLPNYQIESIEDLKIQAFNGQSHDRREPPYDQKKITRGFTQKEYRELLKSIGIL